MCPKPALNTVHSLTGFKAENGGIPLVIHPGSQVGSAPSSVVCADWLTLSSGVVLPEQCACRIAKGTGAGREVVILKLLNSSFFLSRFINRLGKARCVFRRA